MPISPDQLRAQRELVKRHLDWLDARIAEASDAPLSTMKPTGEPAPDTAVRPSTVLPADLLPEAYADGVSGLTPGAKFGCIALAAAIAIGFLFLLFGLPWLVYGKKKTVVSPEVPVVASPAR